MIFICQPSPDWSYGYPTLAALRKKSDGIKILFINYLFLKIRCYHFILPVRYAVSFDIRDIRPST